LERFPQAGGRRCLLFIGRLHFKKGIDRILAALRSVVQAHPQVLLTIVGDGTPDYEEGLRRMIMTFDLGNHVLMTGRMDGMEKWGAYAAAEIFLLPSRQENFALTVAEAMHMGIPVVISDKVNTWPYVVEAGAGIVLGEETIVEDMAWHISRLLGYRAE